MKPTLSVCCITRDSAARLEWWFKRVRDFADEVLVAVDARSGDDTYEVARRLADRVESVELDTHAEPAKDWLAQRASGDWLLLLDDDEALSHDAAGVLPSLLADRRYTSYHLPIRWVVADTEGTHSWIRSHPWHGCHWLRLWRHLPGLYYIPTGLHTDPVVAGHSRALPADGSLALYHLDLLWTSRATREAKAERYRQACGPGEPSCEEFYLYEDYADIRLVPLPSGECFPTEIPRRAPSPVRFPPPATTLMNELCGHAADRATQVGLG